MHGRTIPLLILGSIILLIIFANFSPSHFLMGWDNLITELDIRLNLKRAIFSVWEEYQGLGVLAGNAHAADLPRQIIILILSFFAPLDSLRWIYVFSMLLLGTFSSYFLIEKLLEDGGKNRLPAFLGSLFYLLNLATVQNFFIPFEPFITFYGFLPLLLLTSVIYIKVPNKKSFLFFVLTSILSIPLAQVPTMFIVYLFTLFCVLLGLYFDDKTRLRNILKIFLATLLLNSFWLLPFIYFTLTNSSVAFSAKINQMSTQAVLAQNKEFGNITDVMLLKGFWFNNIDLTQNGYFAHMFDIWRGHLRNPLIAIVGYSSFFIILIGVARTVRAKSRFLLGFLLLFLSVVIFLTIETPPFSFINSALRQIPMFNQVFRSPFTKFSTVASLTYALFFAIGLKLLFDEILKRTSKEIIIKILASGITFMLIIYMLPIFNGHFFYSRLKNSPPKEYLQVFDYFKKQDSNTRIANFPQDSFWGWSFYKWPARQGYSPQASAGGGYGGSGFLWYGLPQPILDRAFDVWSGANENYYWEISQAIYSKNSVNFSKIINKYQISWLLIDRNIISSSSQKDLFVPQLKDMISGLADIKKTAAFGNIDIYKVGLKDKPKKFVFLTGHLPVINGYKWGSNDVGYFNNGNNITVKNQNNSSFDYFYPFRSLFSNKTKNDQEFGVKENKDSLDFIANLYPSENTINLSLPSFNQVENVIPIEIISQKNDDGSISIKARVKTPEVFIKDSHLTKIWEEKRENTLLTIPPGPAFPYNVDLNGAVSFSVDGAFGEKILGSAFLIKGRDNIITVTNNKLGIQNSQVISTDSLDYNSGIIDINLPKLERESQIIVRVGKIDDKYLGFVENPKKLSLEKLSNCDRFRNGQYHQELTNTQSEELLNLSSHNATACTSYYLPNLIHDQGYLILIRNSNQKGSPLHFWVLNQDEDYAPINTYLNTEKNLSDSVIILPPQEKFGLAYSFHFENPSIADLTINNLGRTAIYPIPYNFLTQIKLFRQDPVKQTRNSVNFDVYHPNESLYSVRFEGKPSIGSTLILSQAFNSGWKAYGMVNSQWSIVNKVHEVFPFIFGKPVGEHVMVNNWANGWTLDQSSIINHQPASPQGGSSIIIVYLPQYLEYIGIILTFGTLTVLTFLYTKRRKI